MSETTNIISAPADTVRVGDTLYMSHGFVGRVTELPEWEDIDGTLVGTIICEGFGAFVFSDDEMRVSR